MQIWLVSIRNKKEKREMTSIFCCLVHIYSKSFQLHLNRFCFVSRAIWVDVQNCHGVCWNLHHWLWNSNEMTTIIEVPNINNANRSVQLLFPQAAFQVLEYIFHNNISTIIAEIVGKIVCSVVYTIIAWILLKTWFIPLVGWFDLN